MASRTVRMLLASYKGSKEVLEMYARYDGTNDIILQCTVGVHPHDATRTINGPGAETFDRDLESLIVSESTNQPVFLHSRDSHVDFLDTLKPFLPSIKEVAHCH